MTTKSLLLVISSAALLAADIFASVSAATVEQAAVKSEIDVANATNSFIQVNEQQHRGDRCSAEAFDAMDAMVARIMAFGPHGRPFPLDQEQLAQFCR